MSARLRCLLINVTDIGGWNWMESMDWVALGAKGRRTEVVLQFDFPLDVSGPRVAYHGVPFPFGPSSPGCGSSLCSVQPQCNLITHVHFYFSYR